jgi:hypothetical protein
MAFSSKLKADYIELFNAALDSYPFHDLNEFQLLKDLLQDWIDNKELVIQETFHGFFETLDDYNHNPECYVQNKSDFKEFQDLLKARILAKIDEIGSMSYDEKQKIIEDKQLKQKEVAEFRNRIAQSEPPQPGTESHTISEEEWLLQEQLRVTPILNSILRDSGIDIEYSGYTSSNRHSLFYRHNAPRSNFIKDKCNSVGIYPSDEIIDYYINNHILPEAFGAPIFYEFRECQIVALQHLINIKNFTIDEAFREICGIASVECIPAFDSIGLRREHIHQMEQYLSENTDLGFFCLDLAIKDMLDNRDMTAEEVVENFKAMNSIQLSGYTVD